MGPYAASDYRVPNNERKRTVDLKKVVNFCTTAKIPNTQNMNEQYRINHIRIID